MATLPNKAKPPKGKLIKCQDLTPSSTQKLILNLEKLQETE